MSRRRLRPVEMIRPAGSTIAAPTGMLPARRPSQASSNERCHAGFGQAIIGGMTQPYDETLDRLRTAYDHGAAARNDRPKQEWKIVERDAFADRIGPGARLLEIGAGTGQDSLYFHERGNCVVAVDLSSRMVAHCRDKGIDAHVMDFRNLEFPAESFDAVYALNCLLHVPNSDLPDVLAAIRAVLRPGGLFFLGVYGGDGHEGPLPDDDHEPARFFSLRTDEQIQEFARRSFDVVDFHLAETGGWPFQSLTLTPRRS